MHVSDAQATHAPAPAAAKTDRRSAAERLVRSPALVPLGVALMTALGAALRITVAGDSVFADELATYWNVEGNGLGEVVSTVHGDAEITPPLYYVAAWLTTQIELTPELLRAPSLLAGTAAIPIVYLLGLRSAGRAAAIVAAAITTLSPFMIFYSAEARGYELMLVLVMLSTLALLVALDGGRPGWWVVYAACSCAAVYTHYTSVFALGAQLLWLLWVHPEARKAALIANAGAVVVFLPWLSGLIADVNSPTTNILSGLSPFTLDAVRIAIEHWSVGYPFVFSTTQLRDLPGTAALVLLGAGLAVALAAFAVARARERPGDWLRRLDSRMVLLVVLALAAPVGAALVSAVGMRLFGTRNLAVSWPGFALTLAALLVASGPRLRWVATVLVIAGFAIGAAKMTEVSFQRPDYEAVAGFVDGHAAPGDVLVDGSVALLSPGPLSGLDVTLDRPRRIFRLGVPQHADEPFTVLDPILPVEEVIRRAARAALGRRIFVVSSGSGYTPDPLTQQAIEVLLARYRLVETRTYPAFLPLTVRVYADRALPQG
jgi:hypothetical protein